MADGSIGSGNRGTEAQFQSWFTHHASPLIDISYTVDMQTGRFTRWKRDAPAAAWYAFALLHKNIHSVNVFVQKIGNLPPCRRPSAFSGQ
jgi:hypothetical protein